MSDNPHDLAPALPSPQPPQIEPASPVKPRKMPRLWGRPKNHAVILQEDGTLDVQAIDGLHIWAKSGAYTPTAGSRFWLPKSIGPGFVTLFSAGNPEPITRVAPKGFGSAHWAHLVGGKLTQLAMGAFEPPTTGLAVKPWVKWALLGLVVALVVGVILYESTQQGKLPGR
jgi:hypothetical protein